MKISKDIEERIYTYLYNYKKDFDMHKRNYVFQKKIKK